MAKCFQDEIKDFPWTRERLAALWSAAKPMIDNGATLQEVTKGLSSSLGLRQEVVLDALSRKPKGVSRAVTQEMWERQTARRTVENQARQMVSQMNTPGWQKAVSSVVNAPRRLATVGHWGVFPKSHAGDMLLTNPIQWAKLYGRSLAQAPFTRGVAHEQRMIAMEIDPDFKGAVRAGLDVQPGGGQVGAFTREGQDIFGKQKPTSPTSRAFDELRFARFQIWKKQISEMSPEEKADLPGMRQLADVINHPTGATAIKSKLGQLMSKFLFAPRLLPAQIQAAYSDPARAMATFAKAYVGRGNASAAELTAARFVGRRLVTLAGSYTAILAAETAYASYTGDERLRPNLTDPGGTGWLRPKLAFSRSGPGYAVPISPTVELWKLPFQAVYAAATAKKDERPELKAAEVVAKYAINRQNPALAVGEEAAFGKQPGTGRPVPFAALPSPRFGEEGAQDLATRYKPALDWKEYLGTKMPIPLASLSHELYDEMRSQGIDHPTAKMWIQAGVISAMSGATGYHFTESRESSPRQR